MNLLTTPVMYGLGAIALAGIAWGGVQTVRLSHEQAAHAKAETKLADYRAEADRKVAQFEIEARATEQRHAADLNRIARETKEQSQEAADAAYNRAVADARSGRLRNIWTCPVIPAAGLPGIGPGAGQPDGQDGLRGESAGRVLRLVAQCQSQRDGLQAVTQSDRKVTP